MCQSTMVSGLQTLSCSSLPGIMEEVLLTDENCKHRAVEQLSTFSKVEEPHTHQPLQGLDHALNSTEVLRPLLTMIDRKPFKNLEHFKILKTYKNVSRIMERIVMQLHSKHKK